MITGGGPTPTPSRSQRLRFQFGTVNITVTVTGLDGPDEQRQFQRNVHVHQSSASVESASRAAVQSNLALANGNPGMARSFQRSLPERSPIQIPMLCRASPSRLRTTPTEAGSSRPTEATPGCRLTSRPEPQRPRWRRTQIPASVLCRVSTARIRRPFYLRRGIKRTVRRTEKLSSIPVAAALAPAHSVRNRRAHDRFRHARQHRAVVYVVDEQHFASGEFSGAITA